MTTTTIRRGKTAGIPFRQSRQPVPVAALLPLESCAIVVAERVQRIGHHRGCCAYVFVRAGQVYVLSDDLPAASRWAIEHVNEWVGCYGGLVDLAGLIADMEGML